MPTGDLWWKINTNFPLFFALVFVNFSVNPKDTSTINQFNATMWKKCSRAISKNSQQQAPASLNKHPTSLLTVSECKKQKINKFFKLNEMKIMNAFRCQVLREKREKCQKITEGGKLIKIFS